MSLQEQINTSKLPQHVAVIMDGNGRWAKQQGKERTFGHESGIKAVQETIEAATNIGIKYLTLYTFSSENWNRPKEEVDAIMELLVATLDAETERLTNKQIRLQAIGDLNSLPKDCLDTLNRVIDKTKSNTGTTMVLALSYSSKWEITEAVKKITQKVLNNDLNIEDITENTITEQLSTANIPDPELMLRTSGETRISNFLLWQLAYAELHFTDILWPDFTTDDFYNAILDFQNRERRFGKTSEQLTS